MARGFLAAVSTEGGRLHGLGSVRARRTSRCWGRVRAAGAGNGSHGGCRIRSHRGAPRANEGEAWAREAQGESEGQPFRRPRSPSPATSVRHKPRYVSSQVQCLKAPFIARLFDGAIYPTPNDCPKPVLGIDISEHEIPMLAQGRCLITHHSLGPLGGGGGYELQLGELLASRVGTRNVATGNRHPLCARRWLVGNPPPNDQNHQNSQQPKTIARTPPRSFTILLGFFFHGWLLSRVIRFFTISWLGGLTTFYYALIGRCNRAAVCDWCGVTDG